MILYCLNIPTIVESIQPVRFSYYNDIRLTKSTNLILSYLRKLMALFKGIYLKSVNHLIYTLNIKASISRSTLKRIESRIVYNMLQIARY